MVLHVLDGWPAVLVGHVEVEARVAQAAADALKTRVHGGTDEKAPALEGGHRRGSRIKEIRHMLLTGGRIKRSQSVGQASLHRTHLSKDARSNERDLDHAVEGNQRKGR